MAGDDGPRSEVDEGTGERTMAVVWRLARTGDGEGIRHLRSAGVSIERGMAYPSQAKAPAANASPIPRLNRLPILPSVHLPPATKPPYSCSGVLVSMRISICAERVCSSSQRAMICPFRAWNTSSGSGRSDSRSTIWMM